MNSKMLLSTKQRPNPEEVLKVPNSWRVIPTLALTVFFFFGCDLIGAKKKAQNRPLGVSISLPKPPEKFRLAGEYPSYVPFHIAIKFSDSKGFSQVLDIDPTSPKGSLELPIGEVSVEAILLGAPLAQGKTVPDICESEQSKSDATQTTKVTNAQDPNMVIGNDGIKWQKIYPESVQSSSTSAINTTSSKNLSQEKQQFIFMASTKSTINIQQNSNTIPVDFKELFQANLLPLGISLLGVEGQEKEISMPLVDSVTSVPLRDPCSKERLQIKFDSKGKSSKLLPFFNNGSGSSILALRLPSGTQSNLPSISDVKFYDISMKDGSVTKTAGSKDFFEIGLSLDQISAKNSTLPEKLLQIRDQNPSSNSSGVWLSGLPLPEFRVGLSVSTEAPVVAKMVLQTTTNTTTSISSGAPSLTGPITNPITAPSTTEIETPAPTKAAAPIASAKDRFSCSVEGKIQLMESDSNLASEIRWTLNGKALDPNSTSLVNAETLVVSQVINTQNSAVCEARLIDKGTKTSAQQFSPWVSSKVLVGALVPDTNAGKTNLPPSNFPPENLGVNPAFQASTLTPKIFGKADPSTVIKLYSDMCVSEIASGSASDFTGPGIQVTVSSGSVSNFWAQSFDSKNIASGCSKTFISYTHQITNRPSVTVGLANSASINSAGQVNFPVLYSGSVSVDLREVDVILSTDGTASCLTKSVLSGTTFSPSVSLSGCFGNGKIWVSIAPGRALDSANNTDLGFAPIAFVTIDNTLPALSVISPVNSSILNSGENVSVAGACSENGQHVLMSGPDVATQTTIPCVQGSFNGSVTLSSNPGQKTFTVEHKDSAGNIVSTNLNITLRNQLPSVSTLVPAAGDTLSAANNVAVSGTCSEHGLNVQISGSGVVSATTAVCTAGNFSANVSLQPGNGQKNITVTHLNSSSQSATASTLVNLNAGPMLFVSNPNGSGHILGLTYTFSGTCETDHTSYAAKLVSGIIRAITCTNGILEVGAEFAGSGKGVNKETLTVSATDTITNVTKNIVKNFTYTMPCPVGFVGVPGKWKNSADAQGLGTSSASPNNSNVTKDPTKDFCVMKYPAKVATSFNAGQTPFEAVYDGNKTFNNMSDYLPESRASGTPWVNITRDQAVDRCNALNEANGFCSGFGCSVNTKQEGFALISNTQWQVLVRNLESNGQNWSGGTSGSGFLWRGHSDSTLGSNTDLHSQTFQGNTQLSLSHPRFDSGTEYFGTGNNLDQNTSAESGWQEKRKFSLSTGESVWDVSGNVAQFVSDSRTSLGIPDIDENKGLKTPGWYSFLSEGVNRFSLSTNLLFGSKGTASIQLDESKNAGKIYGGLGDALFRSSSWTQGASGGMFKAYLDFSSTAIDNKFGFRCTYVPPTPASLADTISPSVSIQRVNSLGTAIQNDSVTLASGGVWHLNFDIADPGAAGQLDTTQLWVQVRRKVATGQTASDHPTLEDVVYKEGLLSSFRTRDISTGVAAFGLSNETGWTLNPSTLQYSKNFGSYINYLVTVSDKTGNISSPNFGEGGTFSVSNIKSCPPGFIGVSALSTSGLGSAFASNGNTLKSQDTSKDFCVMKYPAKVQSANTNAASSFVGGKLEPISNGNKTFTQLSSTYTNTSTFSSNIRYIPESRASGTPWVMITRDDSIKACQTLQMAYLGEMTDSFGTGFQLISNTQWQTVARTAEAQPLNWSAGSAGNGVLPLGRTNNTTSSTEVTNSWCFGCTATSNFSNLPGNDVTNVSISGAPNSNTDANTYFATGTANAFQSWNNLGATVPAGSEQKRTLFIGNSEQIWDLSGNVAHWVSNTRSTLGIPTMDDAAGMSTPTSLGISFKNAEVNRFSSTGNLIFGGVGISGKQYSDSKNAGKIVGGSSEAVVRGGAFNAGNTAGIFATNLNLSATSSNSLVGFRCTYTP